MDATSKYLRTVTYNTYELLNPYAEADVPLKYLKVLDTFRYF